MLSWLVFCLATRATYTRSGEKHSAIMWRFWRLWLSLCVKLTINFASQIVPVNFNSLCEGQKGHNAGQKGHNTGQKGLLRDKRDKTRPFRTKGQEEHLFWLFLFWKISRACSLARGYRASFQISMDYEPFTIWMTDLLSLLCLLFIYPGDLHVS